MSDSPTVSRVADRFAIEVDGQPAGFAQFVDHDGRRVFFHTEVDDAYAGQGLASIVVREALDATREAGLRAVPVCPYVKGWVDKHPDYADLAEDPTRDDFQAVRAVGG